MSSLLNKIKSFGGYSLGDEAKQELKTYMQLLEKNETILSNLKAHNPELAQEVQEFMERHARHKSKGLER